MVGKQVASLKKKNQRAKRDLLLFIHTIRRRKREREREELKQRIEE